MADNLPKDPVQREAEWPSMPPASAPMSDSAKDTDDCGLAETEDFSPAPESRPHWPAIEGYTILRELPPGGMGVVYKARQHKLNRVVALKMVLAGPHATSESISRFKVEAWSAARLQHPNIVQVHDLGEWSNQPYIVMEYVDGGHLGRRISRQSFSFRESAELIEKLARAVQYAHDCGVVHRDLKPGNVLLTRDGIPKIIDFGLAKRLRPEGDLASIVTSQGAVLGTPGYLSPEQAAGQTKDVGPSADIYSLGVMLYELVAGRRPFEGDSELQILEKVLNDEPPSPAWLRPSVPRDLETISLKCLEKDPHRRYASAGDLADDLRRYLSGEPIVARRINVAERSFRWVKRRPVKAIFGSLLIGALALAAIQAWDYMAYAHPTYAHYVDFVERWGAPAGIVSLEKADIAHRDYSYRITRSGWYGPVTRLEAIDSSGHLTPYTPLSFFGLPSTHTADPMDVEFNKPCRADYVYRSGQLQRINIYNQFGVRVAQCDWNYDAGRSTAENVPRSGIVRFLPAALLPPEIDESTFNLKPRSGPSAARFSFSSQGWITDWTYLDEQLQPFEIDSAYCSKHYSQFDKNGLPGLIEFRDAFNNRILTRQADHPTFVRLKYFTNGLLRSVTQLDENERYSRQFEPSRATQTYDEVRRTSQITIEAYDDRAQKLVTTASATIKFDDQGKLLEWRNSDASGNPVVNSEGYSRMTCQTDPASGESVVRYFVDENPARRICSCGAHADADTVRLFRDGAGKLRHETYSLNGKLQLKINYEYDSESRLKRIRYVDGDDELRPSPVAAECTYEYKPDGTVAKQIYRGYAPQYGVYSSKITETEVDGGTSLTQSFVGQDGKPAFFIGVCQQQSWHCAADGSLVRLTLSSFSPGTKKSLAEMWSFDPNSDFYTIDLRYSQGKVSEFTALNRQKQRLESWEGHEAIRFSYKHDGTRVKTFAGFDERQYGFDHWEEERDTQGRALRRSWYDGRNKLVVGPWGYSETSISYDDDRGTAEELQRGFADDPNVAYAKRIYRPALNYEEVTFYDASDRRISHNQWGFSRSVADSHGLQLLDADDRPLKSAARVVYVYPGQRGERVGLLKDDVIVAYDGETVTAPVQLSQLILQDSSRSHFESKRTIRVRRNGAIVELVSSEPGMLRVVLQPQSVEPEAPGT
jgi:tRNA A-37 threonylcarbamoyl transferase component Bud32